MGMNRYDVAVGGVRNGEMYLQVWFFNDIYHFIIYTVEPRSPLSGHFRGTGKWPLKRFVALY